MYDPVDADVVKADIKKVLKLDNTWTEDIFNMVDRHARKKQISMWHSWEDLYHQLSKEPSK